MNVSEKLTHGGEADFRASRVSKISEFLGVN